MSARFIRTLGIYTKPIFPVRTVEVAGVTILMLGAAVLVPVKSGLALHEHFKCAAFTAHKVHSGCASFLDLGRIKIPPHSGGYFGFGHSPNNTSGAQVRIKRLPACAHYLLPVNGSRGSNILNWSASLSLFSWSAMYSVIAFVFFPTVST